MMNIYALHDRVSDHYIDDLFLAVNSSCAVRQSLMNVIKSYNLNDIDLYELGSFDQTTGIISVYKNPILVDWKSYRFPETKAEALAPLELSDEFKRVNEKISLDNERIVDNN